MSKGKVYFVGAGPGDFELITLKGCRLIAQTDVILYDHLIPAELIKLAKPDAELIPAGKFAGKATMPQQKINALLIEKAEDKKIVVRLKGGTPLLFGRGGEEAEACAEAGIEFEVVPGVSSALAAGAYAGIPPTHRDYSSSLAIVTGHRKDTAAIEIPKADTIIFLMAVANIEKIINSLLAAGRPAETKIAAIERAACYNQRVITGKLADFLQTIKKANLQTPAVFIVGKVVELHEKLDWFEKKPNILFPGTHPEKYRHLGNIVHRQLIDCVSLDDYCDVDAVLKKTDEFDWLIFTSVNGVRFFFQRLFAIGCDTRSLHSIKIAAIGRTTANTLNSYGITADICPQVESSAGLLEEFSTIDLKQKKILLPRAQDATKELPDGLTASGAVVETLAVYKTINIEPSEIDFDFIDAVIFTSGSVVRAFVKRFGTASEHVKTYCIGIPSLNEAKSCGIEAEILDRQF